MAKNKTWGFDDYADMIFGCRRKRITDEGPIPKIIEQEVKTGVWNGGTTNKKKKKKS
tara:strand:- start:157 stop:327 length:171 start_codon:yes stop_codon:yes gene_type:complete